MRSWSLLALGGVALTFATDVQDCGCGFLDPTNGQVYTDATIVYFNETTDLGQDFYAEHFRNKKEYGWNTVYRAGALTDNVVIGNSSLSSFGNYSNWDGQSTQLFIDPSNKNHLVDGGSIESMRQDMRYGSFRAFMRGPQPSGGGSAMSMMMKLNRSSSFEIDMLNTNDPRNARMTTLLNGEYPSESKGVNYTTLETGSSEYAPIHPWSFVEVKIDWTKHFLNYTIAQNTSRSVNKKGSIPKEPLPLAFRHWSTGDSQFMQGPPSTRSEANVAWIRAFFNSSLDTKEMQGNFTARCLAETKCNVDDVTLRGSTTYSPEALLKYKEPKAKDKWHVIVAIVSGGATAIGLICLINVFFRRKPWKTMFNGERRYEPAELDLGAGLTSPYKQRPIDSTSGRKGTFVIEEEDSDSESGDKDVKSPLASPATEQDDNLDNGVRRRSTFKGQTYESIPTSAKITPTSPKPQARKQSVQFRTNELFKSDFSFGDSSMAQDPHSNVTSYDFASNMPQTPVKQRQMSLFAQSRAMSTAVPGSGKSQLQDVRQRKSSVFQSVATGVSRLASVAPSITEIPEEKFTNAHLHDAHAIDIKEWNTQPRMSVATVDPPFNAINANRRPTMAEAVPVAAVDLPLPKARSGEKRVNHLAGLVAFACIGVTVIHYCLTFVPYAGGLDMGEHYRSEYWARWTIQPVLMNPIWLGPLFVTSCRFLAGPFLKKGDLKDVAVKMYLRAPRMLIPCIMVAMLEYFFLEQGLMDWLLWLPSISWSSWPYIINYSNFGVFMNDILELAYLIPNAAPQIVSHYCVGVLWTVPVQLQFSYTALLAAVIVRDIKTPYKRFLIYFISIVANWYALCWGSCFWAGVLLADLQITFNVSKWLQERPKIWYPMAIFLWLVAIACPVMSLLEDRLSIPTLAGEHDIHPDETTGRPILYTSRAGYPLYFEPRLATLVFAVTIQFLLETSTWFQAVLSLRIWQPVFPHAYTVYLIHGFIWWSLGSFMVVKLGVLGLPYWANMLITALTIYTCLALTVLALSPLTEMANAAACRNILRWGTEAPVPDRATLSPFPHDLFLGRSPENSNASVTADEETGSAQGESAGIDTKSTGDEKSRRGTMLTIGEVSSSGSSSNSRRGSGS